MQTRPRTVSDRKCRCQQVKQVKTRGSGKVEFARFVMSRPRGGRRGCKNNRKIGLPSTRRSCGVRGTRQTLTAKDDALWAGTPVCICHCKPYVKPITAKSQNGSVVHPKQPGSLTNTADQHPHEVPSAIPPREPHQIRAPARKRGSPQVVRNVPSSLPSRIG